MAARLTNDLFVIEAAYGRINSAEEHAWLRVDCPSCAGTQALRIAYTQENSDRPNAIWARCVNCFEGLVINDGWVSPSSKPLKTVKGLDTDTAAAWDEVRGCLSVGATTAAVHMCRKILLHVAVEKGIAPKDGKGRAPSFAACIDHLKSEGYVTPSMVPWVEKIKDTGNEGAHELTPIPSSDATLVAQFTSHLLVLTYEMVALMEGANPRPTDVNQPPTDRTAEG